jgi:hypothetical protein
MIPIRYVPSRAANAAARPRVVFSAHAVAAGGRQLVVATSSGGWVFDSNLTGTGECTVRALEVTGAHVVLTEGFSGDETTVTFELTHDGAAAEIVVTFNTRPD